MIFKKLFCKHLKQTCLTNFYGDAIHWVSYGNKIIRSAWICKDCGKIIYSEYLEPSCNVINWNLTWNEEGHLVDKRKELNDKTCNSI